MCLGNQNFGADLLPRHTMDRCRGAPSANLVFKILISYKHFFMAVTFPIKLITNCIAILPHEFSSAR